MTLKRAGAQAVGASNTEKAYLPFKNWDRQGGGGTVTAYLAYDTKCFYFAAKVPSMEAMIRFETRDDDAYFYPGKFKDKGKEA
jgi:hypothetical protein